MKSIKEHSEDDLREFKEIQKRRYEEALEQKKREIESSDKASGTQKDQSNMG